VIEIWIAGDRFFACAETFSRRVFRFILNATLVQLNEHRINSREWNLLTFLIDESEPNDPFSDSPSKKIKLDELKELPYIRGAYRTVTDRTFFRELSRLNEMGFIKFMQEAGEWIIQLNFEAIGNTEPPHLIEVESL
jgi:hypothetical protein